MAAVSDLSDLEPTLARVMALVAKTLPYDWGTIALVDAKTRFLLPYRRAGVGSGPRLRRLAPIPPDQGVIGRVAQSRQPVCIPDVSQEPGDNQRHSDTRAEVAVPLMFDDQPVGVLSLESYTANAYTDTHVQQLEALAAVVALTIHHARCAAAERERRERIEHVQAFTCAINSQVQMHALLNLVVWEAAAIFDAPAVSVTLYETDSLTPYTGAVFGLSEGFIHRQRAPLPAAGDEPLYVANLGEIPGGQASLFREEGLCSMLSVPLTRGGHRLGSLDLYSRHEPRRFHDEDVTLAQTLAGQIAVAVDNVHLMEMLEQHAQTSALANRLKSEFLANVSHELRTPMNAIIGFTETMLNRIYGPITDKQADRLETVRRNAYNLLGLIDNMLDLSNIEAGRIEVTLESVYIQQEIEGVIARYHARADARGLTLDMALEAHLPPVRGDTMRVRQVLDTLVDNALKFTEAGGVVIRAHTLTRDGRQWVQCAVQDTGIGVTPQFHEMIFDAFSQVDGSSTREHDGGGLGLAIARKLVDMMGGRIWVESGGVPGEGSVFVFELPAARPASPPETGASAEGE